MKASDLMQRGRSRPFSDGLDFIFTNMDPFGQSHIPQEDYLGGEKVALLKVPIQLLLNQDTQELAEVASMLLFIPVVQKNVIKLHHKKFAYEPA